MVPVFHYILVAVAASSLYSHPTCLNGDFVYDDGGTVTGNPVTLGQVPFEEVWRRDYWGKTIFAASIATSLFDRSRRFRSV